MPFDVRRLFTLADRFLPDGTTEIEQVRRARTIVLVAGLGLVFSNGTALSYALLGSTWSAVSISLITVGLVAVPAMVRRGVAMVTVGHLMTALTAQATIVVATRSGGLSSPSVPWCFMLPLVSYLACGFRGALVWTAVSLVVFAGFFVAGAVGVAFVQDFSDEELSLLRFTGYPGVILSMVAILFMVERVRLVAVEEQARASRALERERILRDMHDGVGGHLMGLLARVRRNTLAGKELVQALEACLDDVRLIVDSLDPTERHLEVALGELRARTQRHCEAAGVQLSWRCEGTEALLLPADQTLDVLRAAQEMVSNAVRHAQARHLEVHLAVASDQWLRVSVRDDGVGFDVARPGRPGRGLTNLRGRATKLNGAFEVASTGDGTRVELGFPLTRSGVG
ncbi:MAG: ATP-binding protein [Myxococcaceae bacterium]|nr:ATP-binding protein [Myxococcaceae bacterium]